MVIKGADIVMVRGDTEQISISCDNYYFQDGDTVEMTVRPQASSATVILHKTATLTDSSDSGYKTALISLQPSDTQVLTPSTYKYDISLTTSLGEVHTIVPASNITFKWDVTHNE